MRVRWVGDCTCVCGVKIQVYVCTCLTACARACVGDYGAREQHAPGWGIIHNGSAANGRKKKNRDYKKERMGTAYFGEMERACRASCIRFSVSCPCHAVIMAVGEGIGVCVCVYVCACACV